MKRAIVVIFALALLLCLLSCSSEKLPSPSPSSIKQTPSPIVLYVGSINSDKYHLPSCRWAKKILPENKIEFHSREAAVKAGYKPCKVCKP